MIDPAIEAIERSNDGDFDSQVVLPDGVEYRGSTTAPVWALVDSLHLGAFIEEE
jgi:hypothetical protein